MDRAAQHPLREGYSMGRMYRALQIGGVVASSFTWLDYSEHERRQMLDVIHLFDEKTTRDELGIGVVRDAFADMFFPGTSTIQTRARYFLFPGALAETKHWGKKRSSIQMFQFPPSRSSYGSPHYLTKWKR